MGPERGGGGWGRLPPLRGRGGRVREDKGTLRLQALHEVKSAAFPHRLAHPGRRLRAPLHLSLSSVHCPWSLLMGPPHRLLLLLPLHQGVHVLHLHLLAVQLLHLLDRVLVLPQHGLHLEHLLSRGLSLRHQGLPLLVDHLNHLLLVPHELRPDGLHRCRDPLLDLGGRQAVPARLGARGARPRLLPQHLGWPPRRGGCPWLGRGGLGHVRDLEARVGHRRPAQVRAALLSPALGGLGVAPWGGGSLGVVPARQANKGGGVGPPRPVLPVALPLELPPELLLLSPHPLVLPLLFPPLQLSLPLLGRLLLLHLALEVRVELRGLLLLLFDLEGGHVPVVRPEVHHGLPLVGTGALGVVVAVAAQVRGGLLGLLEGVLDLAPQNCLIVPPLRRWGRLLALAPVPLRLFRRRGPSLALLARPTLPWACPGVVGPEVRRRVRRLLKRVLVLVSKQVLVVPGGGVPGVHLDIVRVPELPQLPLPLLPLLLLPHLLPELLAIRQLAPLLLQLPVEGRRGLEVVLGSNGMGGGEVLLLLLLLGGRAGVTAQVRGGLLGLLEGALDFAPQDGLVVPRLGRGELAPRCAAEVRGGLVGLLERVLDLTLEDGVVVSPLGLLLLVGDHDGPGGRLSRVGVGVLGLLTVMGRRRNPMGLVSKLLG